jgi:hypothetical protein
MSEFIFVSCTIGLSLAFIVVFVAHLALSEDRRHDSDKEDRARMKRFMDKYSRLQQGKKKQ